MTLYLDTSSVVKLYVTEAGSEVVRQLVGDATVVATSVVAYAETRAALARLRREGVLTASKLTAAKREFDEQWPTYLTLEATDSLCRVAGELAEKYKPSRLRQHPPGVVRRGLPAGGNRRHAVLQLR